MNAGSAEMSQTEKVNRGNVKLGREIREELTEKCRRPQELNNELLMRILRENQDTEYGRKYHFDRISSVEDYQQMVPVTVYDDYAEYIIRMTEDGEENLIHAGPIHHYNKTSGTMGAPKRIPMSDEAIDQYNRYLVKEPFGVIGSAVDGAWLGSRLIRLAESTAEEKFLPCGASYGAVSQKMTRQFREKLQVMYTSPDQALFPVPGTDTRYLHALFALKDPDAGALVAAFYSYLIEFLRYIANNWETLAEDIRTGTIHEGVELPPQVREEISAQLRPDPERAEELRQIFARGFEEPFIPKVWKKLRFIMGIGTGGFRIYADMIRQKYAGPEIAMIKIGLSASEGFFSYVYRPDSEDTCLIPDSVFYEFLPLDAGDDFSRIVTIDGVKEGGEYELIITNTSGFYRYRMRDAVRVVSRYENTPTIEFMYRIDQTVSIMGEKTTEEALRGAADQTAKELGFELVDFSVWPDVKASPVRYQFFMEIGENPNLVSPKEIRIVLEEKLAEANPSMGEKVRKGICGDTRLNFLEKESYALYRDMMIKRGAASSQLKPVRVIANEMQRKFFFRLTDYSAEVMK